MQVYVAIICSLKQVYVASICSLKLVYVAIICCGPCSIYATPNQHILSSLRYILATYTCTKSTYTDTPCSIYANFGPKPPLLMCEEETEVPTGHSRPETDQEVPKVHGFTHP
mgnify:CR=1 FL=1